MTAPVDTRLGRPTPVPEHYSPQSLLAIPRALARSELGISPPLPFGGVDIWNAWELTWLSASGQPRVAAAEIRVPADSDALVESKSLKLYLCSFAMECYPSADTVADVIRRDLAACTGSEVAIRLRPPQEVAATSFGLTGGRDLDALDVPCDEWRVNPDLLSADGATVSEEWRTDALMSLCPITAQPDTGSLRVAYTGPAIDRAGLLRYVVSYRRHQAFHETCVERMFLDILERCRPERLSVEARYLRRGGIDINPFRTNAGEEPLNARLWRQ